jgi:hypothetical protein
MFCQLSSRLRVVWAAYKYLRDKRDIFDKELRDASDAFDKELAVTAQANETAKTESQKPFSAKQQQVYFDLLGTPSLIARITDANADPEGAKAIEHLGYYSGVLYLSWKIEL